MTVSSCLLHIMLRFVFNHAFLLAIVCIASGTAFKIYYPFESLDYPRDSLYSDTEDQVGGFDGAAEEESSEACMRRYCWQLPYDLTSTCQAWCLRVESSGAKPLPQPPHSSRLQPELDGSTSLLPPPGSSYGHLSDDNRAPSKASSVTDKAGDAAGGRMAVPDKRQVSHVDACIQSKCAGVTSNYGACVYDNCLSAAKLRKRSWDDTTEMCISYKCSLYKPHTNTYLNCVATHCKGFLGRR